MKRRYSATNGWFNSTLFISLLLQSRLSLCGLQKHKQKTVAGKKKFLITARNLEQGQNHIRGGGATTDGPLGIEGGEGEKVLKGRTKTGEEYNS